jgi:hypothetical protein
MGVVQLLIDFLLGPLSVLEVLLNFGVLLDQISLTLDLFGAGRGGIFFDALINGQTMIGQAVAGFFGTSLWLKALGSVA